MKRSIILLFSCLAMSFFAHSKTAEIYQQFATLPIMQSPTISPDGDSIAAVYNGKDGPQVVLMKFPTIQFTPLAQLSRGKDRIETLAWSGNRYLIIGASYPEYYRGDTFRVQRLYRLDIKTKDIRELSNSKNRKETFFKYVNYSLASTLRDDPEHILVSTYDQRDDYYTLFKVTLENGTYEKYFTNEEKLDSLRTDIEGNVRVGVKIEKLKGSEKHEKTIWYRESLDEPMKKIHSRILGEGETFDIVALSDDNVHGYVISDRENARQALWLYNIKTNEFEKELFSHPKYDVAGVVHDNEGKVVGVYYYDDYERQYFFNQQQDQLTTVAQNLLPKAQVYIVTNSKDQKRFMFSAQSPERVPVYYYVDLRQQKAGAWLASYPNLVKTQLAEPQKFEFAASDGMQLNGYLTMPHGVKNPPLIVFPHGGPTSRDTKYYSSFVQYFAAKGYAVMQVNFRGSEGFGNHYETSGYFEWGKRMQRDVDDATDYVLANYPVAKHKSCLVGASYGGYVALTEAFQRPDKFDCYISIAGIADLKDLVEHERRDDNFIKNIVPDEGSDTVDKLTEVSAAYHINEIKKPILLIHGTKDTQVSYHQSEEFYSKAKSRIDIEYVEIDNMTHYLDDAEGRMETFKAIDEFLDKHL